MPTLDSDHFYPIRTTLYPRRLCPLFPLTLALCLGPPATAQITPDPTAGTTINTVGTTTTITGGTRTGDTLFHSFSEFSIPVNVTAQFANATDLTTLITRVTGFDPSFIDGTLATAGTADLFFINPNGIFFGGTAQLDVGGSFIASTADSVIFENGAEFSAINLQPASLLTVSTPIGLQYGAAGPADIEVLGPGHGLIIDPDTLAVTPTGLRVDLQVPDGETLALLGGFVTLDGGNLTALDGRIILGSVADNSQITLTPDAQGWTADLSGVQTLADVGLFNASSLVTGNNGSGEVQVTGQFIDVLEGSTILANTLGNGLSQGVTLSATEEIILSGARFDNVTGEAVFPSSILSEVDIFATANGGSVVLDAPYIFVGDGAQVSTSTFDVGNGGDITVNADQVAIVGGTPELGSSGFFLQVGDEFSFGQGGDFTLNADTLTILDGGVIDGSTFGPGEGGLIEITANQIDVLGGATDLGPSRILTQTEDMGNSGDIVLQTDSLVVAGGAEIANSTFGPSDAGRIDITAQEIELVSGAAGVGPSEILSQTEGSGNGGLVTITTGQLTITDGATLASEAILGSGNGGEISISADEIIVDGSSPSGDNSSAISSATGAGSTGNAGNITLQTNQLTVTDGGEVRTSTLGSGAAGILEIQAQSVELIGAPDSTGLFSTVEPGATGMGNNIRVQTDTLTVTDGAQVVTGTLGPGSAGNLDVIANSIILDGRNSNNVSSGLFANALEDVGEGGTITVNANDLQVQNGATINASNFSSFDAAAVPGQGAAGDIVITATTTQLNNQGSLTTATFTGNRGNINLDSDLVLLRNNSAITTNASQTATGGNIVIFSDFLVAVPNENSDITANAEQGQGGRIEITAQGILGLDFPPRLTPNSNITASSDIGLDGDIIINLLNIDPSDDLTALPESFVDASDQVVAGCPADTGANFIATGRGGLPADPTQTLLETPELLLPPDANAIAVETLEANPNEGELFSIITEANTWTQTPQGEIQLLDKRLAKPEGQLSGLCHSFRE